MISKKELHRGQKLTKDGHRVLTLLMDTYGMEQEKAVQLMHDGGSLFAIAMIKISERN